MQVQPVRINDWCYLSHYILSDSLRLLCPGDFPGKNTDVGCHLLLRDIFNPGIKPTSPTLASGFFTTEPPGKCKD